MATVDTDVGVYLGAGVSVGGATQNATALFMGIPVETWPGIISSACAVLGVVIAFLNFRLNCRRAKGNVQG